MADDDAFDRLIEETADRLQPLVDEALGRIPPALTPEEWARVEPSDIYGHDDGGVYVGAYRDGDIEIGARDPAMIALANAALPDSDPRKITREWVGDLKVAQREAQDAAWRSCMNGSPGKPCDECQAAVDKFNARLQRMADALQSYLPPDPSVS